MKKKFLGLLLIMVFAIMSILPAYANQAETNDLEASADEEVIHINLDDTDCPYLIDEEYISEDDMIPVDSNRPTSEWNLDGNQYSWSADINGNTLYSNYYFTGHGGRFRLYAYKPSYSNVKSYTIRVYKRKSTSGSSTSVRTYRIPTSRDADFYSTKNLSGSDQFYFRISGGRRANFAANGFVDTY